MQYSLIMKRYLLNSEYSAYISNTDERIKELYVMIRDMSIFVNDLNAIIENSNDSTVKAIHLGYISGISTTIINEMQQEREALLSTSA